MSVWDNLVPRRTGPKYLAICEALEEAIERGTFPPGKRLPSHRMLAKKLRVSVGTVTRAYEEALERGLITGEVGRGSFVSHHPATRLSVVSSSRIPSRCVDLYQNFPAPIPAVENEAWGDALALLRRGNHLATTARRSWSEVDERNQEAGATWIRRTGYDVEPAGILDCPGTMSALCAIFGAVTQPGDVVLSASLSHPVIKLLAEQYHLKIHGLPQDDDGLDPDAFEAACAVETPKLVYCAPTIHSPTTKTMPLERRREIARIADRHGVYIVEDESSGFLMPEPPLPIAALVPRRTFFVGDVWLALSPGLRTTYLSVPQPMRPVMSRTVAATSGLTTPLIAEIAAMWIETDVADRLIEHRRAELLARNAIARELLGGRGLHADPCGHHVWLELPEPWRSDLFVLRAEQLGIAVGGAEWFAVGRGPVPEAVRICIGNVPGHDVLRQALRSLDRLIDEPRSSNLPSH